MACCDGDPGVWPYDEDITNGTAAEPSCMQRSPDGKLVVVGDSTGLLRLHKYPCVRKEVRRDYCMTVLFAVSCR